MHNIHPAILADITATYVCADTDALQDIIDDEAAYPGTYYPEVMQVVCLILSARGDRQDGYAGTAEMAEERVFDLLTLAQLFPARIR